MAVTWTSRSSYGNERAGVGVSPVSTNFTEWTLEPQDERDGSRHPISFCRSGHRYQSPRPRAVVPVSGNRDRRLI
jgi:hypothetical protein